VQCEGLGRQGNAVVWAGVVAGVARLVLWLCRHPTSAAQASERFACDVFERGVYLIAKAFATAGGHDHQPIAPRQHAGDDLLLAGSECTEAPVLAEQAMQLRAGTGFAVHFRPVRSSRDAGSS
jgi:hypothetical protein